MKKREKKPVDAGPGWLATYGDLVTLLLAFFVMLFAVTDTESKKFQAFLSGLGHFKNSSAEQGVFPVSPSSEQMVINAGIKIVRAEPEETDEEAADRAVSAAKKQAENEGIEQQITEALKASGIGDTLSFRPDPRGVAAVLATDNVLFAVGQAELTPSGAAALEGLAAILKPMTYKITIEGHADNTPLNRGSYTNWNLSTDRAVTAVQYLERLGIGDERLTAAGHGASKPLDPADTAEARARNRRIEIVIHTLPTSSGDTVDPTTLAQPPPVDIRPALAGTTP